MSTQNNTEPSFLNNIVTMAGKVAESVSEVSHMVIEGSTSTITSTLNTVETAAENLAHNIKEQVTGTIETASEKIFGTTDTNEIKEEVIEKATEAKDTVVQNATVAQSNLSAQASVLSSNMSETVSTAASKIGETAQNIKEAVVQKGEQAVEQAQHTMENMKETAGQKLEGAKEFVSEKVEQTVPVGVRTTSGQTYGQIKSYVADLSKATEQKMEQVKESVSEKIPVMKKAAETKVEQVKELVSRQSTEMIDDINTIPLPVEVTLAAKDNAVVAESLPNFVEPSNEGEWEEVKNYHTIVQENKSEKQESIPAPQPIVEKSAEPVKMVPADDSTVPQTEGNVWPVAETIKLSNETAWTNPEKTREIVQNLNQESSSVLTEERK